AGEWPAAMHDGGPAGVDGDAARRGPHAGWHRQWTPGGRGGRSHEPRARTPGPDCEVERTGAGAARHADEPGRVPGRLEHEGETGGVAGCRDPLAGDGAGRRTEG